MPFVVAKVDRNAWENERGVMRNLIRSFGPNGGGVFTKSTELELLQASNSGGDVYFKLLEYTSKAITKVILGQLASSSESGGLSGGERQKLAIARALIRRPEILIFDEVTNHLDYESRLKMRDLLGQLRGHTTVLLVSHDPELIKLCDMEICL